MQTSSILVRVFALVASILLAGFSGGAWADPSARVARLSYTTGTVSFSPAGEDEWVAAAVNRPLTNGDRFWLDTGSRAEIQDGGSLIRMQDGSSVSLINLDDHITQLQLSQGSLSVRVRRLAPNQVIEVDTPNLAFTVRQPGEFRLEVNPDGTATDITVRQGQGEAAGQGAGYLIDSQQRYRFYGNDLRDYEFLDAPRADEFDRWTSERDSSFERSASARYVSADVVGYQDLDAGGTWRANAAYGNVWFPSRVAADWAPYRDGHWSWIDPWGWTWVDDAPWGFAVSHYGRWASVEGRWGWVPGPVRSTAYYAPALVAFVGGSNFQLSVSSGNVGGVAWFPLAPNEAYRPSYAVSRSYYESVNRSNTVITNTVINNSYSTTNVTNVTNVVYANRQVPGAVIAVPAASFAQSQPVARAQVRVTQQMMASAPVGGAATVVPTLQSVRGAAVAGAKPPPRVFDRPVVAHSAPPPAPVAFAAQQKQLALKPGQPLDQAALKALKPAAAVVAPTVKVLAPAPVKPAKAMPAPVPQANRPANAQARPGATRVPAASAPAAPAPAASVPAVRPVAAPARLQAPASAPQRAQPIAPAPAPASLQRAPESRMAAPHLPPSAAAPASLQRAPESRMAAPRQAPSAAAPSLTPHPQAVPSPAAAPMPAAHPESLRVTGPTGSNAPVVAPKPPAQRLPESMPVAPHVAPMTPVQPPVQSRQVPPAQVAPHVAPAAPAATERPVPTRAVPKAEPQAPAHVAPKAEQQAPARVAPRAEQQAPARVAPRAEPQAPARVAPKAEQQAPTHVAPAAEPHAPKPKPAPSAPKEAK